METRTTLKSQDEETRAESKETVRLEAFSDGVFSIAATLLVLNIRVPTTEEVGLTGSLLLTLARQWPTFLGYLVSFATILVMWVNHHNLIGRVRKSTQAFLFLNGLLLLFIAFVPFPTALLAEYIEHPQAWAASAVYAGTYTGTAIAFNLLWRYTARNKHLLDLKMSQVEIDHVSRQYLLGPLVYFAAFVLAFVYVPASVALCFLLAVFFAVTGASGRAFLI